jgi:hypothetical protein
MQLSDLLVGKDIKYLSAHMKSSSIVAAVQIENSGDIQKKLDELKKSINKGSPKYIVVVLKN